MNAKAHTMEGLSLLLAVHIDTLYRARRNGASKRIAPRLELATGIPAIRWLYPFDKSHGKNPWDEYLINGGE